MTSPLKNPLRRAAAAVALLCGACASQPPEATLATTCNGIAAVYRSAATLKTAGKLSAGAITALTDAEQPVKDVCDPTKPPVDLASALATAQTILNQISAQIPAQ